MKALALLLLCSAAYAKPVPRESTRRIQRLLSDFSSPNGTLLPKIEIDGVMGAETKRVIERTLRDLAASQVRK